jgi:hypothetical protein
MTAPTKRSTKPSTAKAMFDVAAIPSSFYGAGRARHIRKLVHMMLANHANPDGTSIFPSLDTLAEECGGLSTYALRQHLDWLEHKAQLIVTLPGKHPVFSTNQYELRMPPPDAIEQGKQQHQGRVAAKRRSTRERTARWRQKLKSERESVTQESSVTSRPVTQLPAIGDATLEGSVTQLPDVGDATSRIGDIENRAFSASTVLIPSENNRPITVINTNPISSSANLAKPVAGDGGTLPSSMSSDQGEPVSGCTDAEREAFLIAQVEILHENGCDNATKATKAHLEQAWAAAQKYGVDTYLGTLRLWLDEFLDEETRLSETADPITGKVRITRKSWPLKTFLDSPSFHLCVRRVRPIVEKYGVSGNTLDFLVHIPELPDLTPEQIGSLDVAVNHDAYFARSAYEDMNDDSSFFDDPLGAMERYDAELAEKRKQMRRRLREKKLLDDQNSPLPGRNPNPIWAGFQRGEMTREQYDDATRLFLHADADGITEGGVRDLFPGKTDEQCAEIIRFADLTERTDADGNKLWVCEWMS